MPDHPIGPLSQIPPGEGRNFRVAGQLIAVFHTRAGSVFATQAHCPHRGGPLADGLIDEKIVICPLHERAYAFVNGEGIGNECAITVYATRIESGGYVFISV